MRYTRASIASVVTLTCLALIALAAQGCAPDTSNTPAGGSEMPRSIIDPYLKISSALAQGSVDGLRANAGEIATAATSLGAPAVKIDMTAVQLISATELEDARDKFGALSEALVAYMDGLKLTLPDDVQVAVCSMKQKPWLQAGADIQNPYYGASMTSCSSFR